MAKVLEQLCDADTLHFGRVTTAEHSAEPAECFGHSLVLDRGRLLAFGGADIAGALFYNAVWMCDLSKPTWSAIRAESAPDGRHFHSCVLYDRSLWVFGGSSNSNIFQDLFRFNLDTLHWSAVATAGVKPSPRHGHSAVVYNDQMYVYGGSDRNGFNCNDLVEFSFATLTWEKPVLGGAAQEAFHHTAVVYQGSMYTFGGYRKTYNEIQEYRFATKSWSFLHTSGTPPKPRWGHAAVVCGRNMFVFGGRDRVSNFQDLHSFDFETRVWRRLECDGIDGRFFCAAAVHDGERAAMYVFGGRNIHSFAFNDTLRVSLSEDEVAPDGADLQALVGDPEFANVVFVMPDDPALAEVDGAPLECPGIAIPPELRGARRIFAHREIVCNRSPALAVMLASPMQEGRTGVVALRGTTARAVRALLVYLYTDLLVAETEELRSVLELANQWQLAHLKHICQERMALNLSLSTAVATLALAQDLDAALLFEACRTFIHKNARVLAAELGQLGAANPSLHASVLALASPTNSRVRPA